LTQIRDVGDFLKSEMRDDDRLFVSSGAGSMVYLAADYVPETHIFHSGFLIADFAPHVWRDSIRAYLLSKKPRFIVLQTSDRMNLITHSEVTSVELFRSFKEVWKMMENEYTLVFETKAFKVYSRNRRAPDG
jgi:hypothetical protein